MKNVKSAIFQAAITSSINTNNSQINVKHIEDKHLTHLLHRSVSQGKQTIFMKPVGMRMREDRQEPVYIGKPYGNY